MNRLLIILYTLHYTYCFGPGLFKLSSNSYDEWNPSLSVPASSSASIASSSSISSSAVPAALPYSGDTNSYAYWNCHTIPPNMTLCKSVGYSRMVLPNFLQHESLREAIQQANVWIALVNTDCHPDIQRFLCSLYAPVCLKSHQEAKIPPCWELCDQVRNACLPRMKLFGFDWPDIVRCQQFPRLAESMCIPPQEKSTAVTCVPCEQAITLENIASSYCMADVVLKASIKDMVLQPNQASIILNLTPRTLALKLIRNDGTQLSSIDQYRRKRNSRRRRYNNNNNNNNNNDDNGDDNINNNRYYHHHMRVARDLKIPAHRRSSNQDRYQSKYLMKSKSINSMNEESEWRQQQQQQDGSKSREKRRRRPRNSRLHDLDGITELILGCSSCNPLLPYTSGRMAHSLPNQKWLVMGRRIQDSATKKYTNQLQVTFLGLWNRESAEFRQSLNAIRKEPVAHLCNKNQASLSVAVQPQAIQYNHPGRTLKILRSAPSELSDSPNYENADSRMNSHDNNNNNNLYRPAKSNKKHSTSSLSNYDARSNSQGNVNSPYHRQPKTLITQSPYDDDSNNDIDEDNDSFHKPVRPTYQNTSYRTNLERNTHVKTSNDAQNTYLKEIHQLQRQNSRKVKRRERKRKRKVEQGKRVNEPASQNQYGVNSYSHQLPINPYAD
ncbi:unnamed protein product [Trichobilharzia szidati]|nr:unnamed protein product [Trichobilharzia szidati]